ncbi:MAG: hypothetical protein ACRED8_01495 [Caulobacteraceae bacterium]
MQAGAESGASDGRGPPKARLAFRVGVVGHRPDRLPEEKLVIEGLAARVAFVLSTVKQEVEAFAAGPDAELYTPEPPRLFAVSSLAEGVDRLFAEAALELGYALVAPMPFPRSQFEADFEGPDAAKASLVEFRAIQDRAAAGPGLTRFELDGTRERPEAAYAAAGEVVVAQSDLLIAVWDGGPGRGPGGTLETLGAALAVETPVLWISPFAPFAWRVMRSEDDLAALGLSRRHRRGGRVVPLGPSDETALEESLAAIVRSQLSAPAASAGDGRSRQSLAAWFAERQPRFDPFILWRAFRNLVGEARLTLPTLGVDDFIASPPEEWREEAGVPDGAVARLWPHFAFADGLAAYYADAHRSGFIATSLLAAAAVFAALIPVALGIVAGPHAGTDLAFIAAEIAILIMLGASLFAARRGRWHERWLEYRMLAEWIRQLRFLVPLGGGRPLPKSQAHLAVYGEPTESWMYWLVRALAREAALPDAACDPAYLRARLADLSAVIGDGASGQIGFHQANARRSKKVHDRLHGATSTLVFITIIAVAVEFALRAIPDGPLAHFAASVGGVFVLLGAGLPAFGAALASINNLGEFAHTAKRSAALAEAFARLMAEADALASSPTPPASAEVQALAARMSAIMVEEGVDWRVVMLELPHQAG